MTRDEILQAFDRIRVWQRHDQRAPHKPLLILYELGRIARGEPAEIEYNDIEPELQGLLEEFGPSGAKSSRHYPFWHLQSDGFWELQGLADRPMGATPTIQELRERRAKGRLIPVVRDALASDRSLRNEVARRLVSAHFPPSIQQDVLDAVGLDIETASGSEDPDKERIRDPNFRKKVLLAYEYRCCLCGYDIRLDTTVIGLEAAHIKWFQAGGPDVEPNGLALCALHHKIFDLGAFTIEPSNLEVQFSRHMVGSADIQARLLAYHGTSLILPQSFEYKPNPEYLKWHYSQVFKGPARE